MDFLKALNINGQNPVFPPATHWIKSKGEKIVSYSPVDGQLIGSVTGADRNSYECGNSKSSGSAFKEWRTLAGT